MMITEYTKNGIDYKIETMPCYIRMTGYEAILNRYENGVLKFSCFVCSNIEVHLQRRFELVRLGIDIKDTSTPIIISKVRLVAPKGAYPFVSMYIGNKWFVSSERYNKRVDSLETVKNIFERIV